MKKFYCAVIQKDEDGYYFVEFPDLNSCFTQGNTLEEACYMAEDVLGEWISTNEMLGNLIPEPTDITVVIKNHPNDIVNMFGYDDIEWKKTHSTKAVKKMVSIPEWLDTLATQQGLSLSKVLQAALKKELNIQ